LRRSIFLNMPPPAIPDDSSDTQAALKLWVVLSRAHASIYAHAVAHAADHGLSLAEFAILEVLYHRGRMLLGEIQRRILVSSGGITFLVDRLAEKGLVIRQECTEDRRAKWASLTREGTRLIQDIFPSHADAITAAMRGLTRSEQREATRLLRALGLGAAGGELPPTPATLRQHRRRGRRRSETSSAG
jgi:MarR family 2-MHQ and catechol resistance regulon transcriptional repressor